jgi:hypothetical protein
MPIMLRKVLADELGKVDVTFELPPTVIGETAAVAGEFNAWSVDANPMARGADGAFRTTLTLEIGRHYRFRYVIDGVEWVNAWDADEYVPNGHGGDDSVVRTDNVGE